MTITVDPVTGFMQDDGIAAAPLTGFATGGATFGEQANPLLPKSSSTPAAPEMSPLSSLADILAGSAAPAAKMLGSAGLMHVKGVSPAGKAIAPQGIDPSIYTQLASLLTGGR